MGLSNKVLLLTLREGLTASTFLYTEIKNIPLPEYRPLLDAAMNRLIEGGRPYGIEFKIKAADTGEIKDIYSSALFDKDKKILLE